MGMPQVKCRWTAGRGGAEWLGAGALGASASSPVKWEHQRRRLSECTLLPLWLGCGRSTGAGAAPGSEEEAAAATTEVEGWGGGSTSDPVVVPCCRHSRWPHSGQPETHPVPEARAAGGVWAGRALRETPLASPWLWAPGSGHWQGCSSQPAFPSLHCLSPLHFWGHL